MHSFDERCSGSGERFPSNRASRREAALTWLAILLMMAAFTAFVAEVARYLLRDGAAVGQILEGAVYVALVSLLMYGALVYLCATDICSDSRSTGGALRLAVFRPSTR